MDFAYDGQIRRYLVQFLRIFSDLKIRNGPDENGMYTLQRVPIVYGDPSNMVAQIIKGQSENTLLPVPMMSAYIDGIKMDPNRRQDTQYVQPASSVEREFDSISKTYKEGPGVRYTVDRYMPVPYEISFKLDIWTSNVTNKLQLLEQIGIIFNPSIVLQQNQNIFDWTSIFEVWMEGITWTNRSIPQGADMDRDVMTLKFKVPIWINPPAKVKRSTIVSEIVTNVFMDSDIASIDSILDNNIYDPFKCFDETPVQIVTTVGQYEVSVEMGSLDKVEITLLHPYGNVLTTLNWESLFKAYGRIEPGITNIRLKLNTDLDVTDTDVIGTIAQDPTRPNVLFFNPDIDTLPANTLPSITTIIDPTISWPGNNLPVAISGQRYLLTGGDNNEPVFPPGIDNSPWGNNIVAYTNDIIQYNGTEWVVIFDSTSATGKNYTINNSNNSQYMFSDNVWSYSYFGTYSPGYWRITNLIKESPKTCPPNNGSITDTIEQYD